MAQVYNAADKAVRRDEKRPFEQRIFMLLLLSSPLAEFDPAHATVDDVLKPPTNQDEGRYALRTQVISDPTRPLGGGAEILQFFMVDPNRDILIGGTRPAVMYEVTGTGSTAKEVPLFKLTASETSLLTYGAGFSTPLRT